MLSALFDPLTCLAVKYGSDKFGSHLYTPVYHQLFQHMRDKPLRMLEIGIGGYDMPTAGGLSLHMWAEYFPKAQIVGLDLYPKQLSIAPHVHIVAGSQSDSALLVQLSREYGPFDIIIDDGSHRVADARASFFCLYSRMAPHGLYIVEDIQTSFSPYYGGARDGTGSMFDVAHRLSLMMHQQEGYLPRPEDHEILELGAITQSVQILRNQIVFQRGANGYPSVRELDFRAADVQHVYAALEEDMKHNPAPGNYLTRIE